MGSEVRDIYHVYYNFVSINSRLVSIVKECNYNLLPFDSPDSDIAVYVYIPYLHHKG
jgi:hypothetical protein